MHHTQNLLDKNQKKEFLQKKYECMNARSLASQTKRREENCIGRYSRGLRNQNGENLGNYMNQTS